MITGMTLNQRHDRDFIRLISRLLYRGNRWRSRSDLPARRLQIIRFRALYGAIPNDRYIPHRNQLTGEADDT